MKKYHTGHERESEKSSLIAPMVIEVQIRQPHRDCPMYTWDREPDGRTQHHIFPFHSPAIAWFLPLFTRLRLLLSGPYRER